MTTMTTIVTDTLEVAPLHAAASVLEPTARLCTTQLRIERSQDRLRIVATDGNVATHHTLDVENVGEETDLAVNLPIANLKSLPRRGRVTIAWESHQATLVHETGVQICEPLATPGVYPDWRRAFALQLDHNHAPEPALLDPALVQKVHKAGMTALGLKRNKAQTEKEDPGIEFTLLQFGANAASVLCWEHNPHWVGLIMPLSRPNASESTSTHGDLLNVVRSSISL